MILTQTELQTLTGFKRRAEQKKELDHLEIAYKVRRNGSLVVEWGEVHSTITGSAKESEPVMHL